MEMTNSQLCNQKSGGEGDLEIIISPGGNLVQSVTKG
jgi:hypothetical protein